MRTSFKTPYLRKLSSSLSISVPLHKRKLRPRVGQYWPEVRTSTPPRCSPQPLCTAAGTTWDGQGGPVRINTAWKRKLSLGEVWKQLSRGRQRPAFQPPPHPLGSRRCWGCWGYISPVTCAESVLWHAARWLHWVTILRSGELEMMDLELTRWKRVGLFYKQLKSSPQTVFLNSVLPVELLAFWACRLHREREQKRQCALSRPY